MKLKQLYLLIFTLLASSTVNSQILHTESFALILDTSQRIKGNIVPDFKFQNLKRDLVEFQNTTDISFRFKHSGITVANKIEFARYGNEAFLSGGFLYLEYRRILENRFVIEPMSSIHWSEARGLKFKYAGGFNFRYQIYSSSKVGLYAGSGPFYEYERWNYDGVKDQFLPSITNDVYSEKVKLGTYLSFKVNTESKLDFDLSLYHQSTFNELFSTPRLASSTSIKYNFTEHLGLIFQYQNIYDYNPVVPIDKLFNQLILTFEVSF